MSPSHTDLHEVATDEELDELVEQTLNEAGIDIADLRSQAHLGRFESEKFRRAWFVIDGLGRG